MINAFGDKGTIPASEKTKEQMEELLRDSCLFSQKRDIWLLGAALGIKKGEVLKSDKRDTFERIDSLDPDKILAAMMMGLYPEMPPEERVKKIVDHAEWGINDIYRKYKDGILDLYTLDVEG